MAGENGGAASGEAHSTATAEPAGAIDTKAMDTAHDGFLGDFEKFLGAKPEEAGTLREELAKKYEGYKTERQKVAEAKTAKEKADAEAAKNVKPPDYKTAKLPDKHGLSEDWLKETTQLAQKSGWDVPTLEAVIKRDAQLLEKNHAKNMADFKAYNDEAIKTLEKDWGEQFKPNVEQVKRAVDFFEKQIPGIKAEIERLGLSSSVTANKFFKFIHDEFEMANDKFEFGVKMPPRQDPKNRTTAQDAAALAPKSMAHLTAGAKQ